MLSCSFCMKSKLKWHDVLSVVAVHVSVYQTVALVLPESAETDDDDTGEFKELVYDSIQEVRLESRFILDIFTAFFSRFLLCVLFSLSCSPCCNEQIWTPGVIADSCTSNANNVASVWIPAFRVDVKIVAKPNVENTVEYRWAYRLD